MRRDFRNLLALVVGRFCFRCLGTTFFLIGFSSSVIAAFPGSPTPPTGAALQGLTFHEGWIDPHALSAPVNTPGWQDSSFISADGSTLYFAYTQLDFDELMKGRMVISGPARPGQHGVRFEIYEAKIDGQTWKIQNSTVNSMSDLAQGAVGVDANQSTMVFAKFDRGIGRLQISRRGSNGSWEPATPILRPLNPACTDDNPTLSADGTTLWFDSSRNDAAGATCTADNPANDPLRSIYQSKFVHGAWSLPELMPGAPNQTRKRWQIFVSSSGKDAYWAGSDTDCAGGSPNSCLYHAKRQPDGTWGQRTVVVQTTPRRFAKPGQVVAIGEPSITADGQFLYFVYGITNANNQLSFSIGVVRQR